MKINKLLPLTLAGTMALSMAVPAFAEGETDPAAPKNQTVITTTYKEIEIAVTVPTTVTAFINPYGLPMKIDEAKDDSPVLSGKIASLPATVSSQCKDVDLQVGATVTATLPEDTTVKLATEPLAADDTSKSIYSYLEVASSALTGASDAAATNTAFATEANWKTTQKTEAITARGVTNDNLATLKKADKDGKAVDGGVAMFRIAGDVVQTPNVAWDAKDTLTYTIQWTFMPATTTNTPAGG